MKMPGLTTTRRLSMTQDAPDRQRYEDRKRPRHPTVPPTTAPPATCPDFFQKMRTAKAPPSTSITTRPSTTALAIVSPSSGVRQVSEKDRAKTRRLVSQSQRFAEVRPVAAKLGRSVLEMAAVQPRTLWDYFRRLGWFQKHITTVAAVSGHMTDDLDEEIVKWFDLLFERGCSSEDGAKFMAALQHVAPKFKDHTLLPRAFRAIKGWKRLRPLRSRVPLPWQAFLAILGSALHKGLVEEATALLLTFVCYLRPADLFALQPASFVKPVAGDSQQFRHWSLLLGAFETGRPNKTGEFDESSVIDWTELAFLDPLLDSLSRRPRRLCVWNFDITYLTTVLKDCARDSSTDHLQPQLYSLRHGGASWDCLSRRRRLDEIKKRGRWRSDSSVRRYEKAALAAAEANKLSPLTIAYADKILANLADYFTQSRPVPAPPMTKATKRTWQQGRSGGRPPLENFGRPL